MHPIADLLRSAQNAVWALGGEVEEFVFEEIAGDSDVAGIEKRLGLSLPKEFRAALTGISSRVRSCWRLPDDAALPSAIRQIFAGRLEWSLESLPELEEGRRLWADQVFANSDIAYDRVWHNKLAIQAVPNGDYLALDLSEGGWGRVVYLSHDDGQGHGYVLGRDFLDFLNRWVPLGCPGPEDWQWLPFTSDKDSGIDPECQNAKEWLRFLYGE